MFRKYLDGELTNFHFCILRNLQLCFKKLLKLVLSLLNYFLNSLFLILCRVNYCSLSNWIVYSFRKFTIIFNFFIYIFKNLQSLVSLNICLKTEKAELVYFFFPYSLNGYLNIFT